MKKAMPTMADYWEGTAHFRNYYNEPKGSSGTEIVVLDGIWYRFERYQTGNDPETGIHLLGTQVLKSADKGMTWSEPVSILAPCGENAWSMCATDSGAFYDGSRWHLIFQSWDRRVKLEYGWNLSYIACDEKDPTTGTWYVPEGYENPVVKNRDIWNQIAVGDNDCTRITGGQKLLWDEGTPKIHFENGTIYLTFHGASHTNGTIYGYRGVATTTDFKTFTKAADDCIFDCDDAKDWNVHWNEGGSVGGGHATYIKEGEYWYTMIESPDTSLACVPDQNWTFGLLRSKTLTNTSWENWAGNPMPECAPTGPTIAEWVYPCLFKSGDTTYMAITHNIKGDGYKQYMLEWKNP